MDLSECKIGMRVRMTDPARKTFPQRKPHSMSGTITGFGKYGVVKIQRDGIKFPDTWSPEFWEPDNA